MTTNHEHLREVAEKATPGPWNFSNAAGEWVIRDANQKYLGGLMKGTRQLSNTAVFIATFNPATAIALLDELAALRKENEALKADAERYRWMRDHSVFCNDSMQEIWFDSSNDRGDTEGFDQAIDAARAAIGDSHE